MEKSYFTPENEASVAAILGSFDGAAPSAAPLTEFDTLTRGPLAIDVTMPLNDANVAAVVAARFKAVDIWLGWQLDDSHRHKPGAPVNSQYVFDTPAKQNMYSALLATYTELYGND